MKRDKTLLERRVTLLGLYFEIMKARGDSRKKAVLVLAETFLISEHTVRNSLLSYKKRPTTRIAKPLTP